MNATKVIRKAGGIMGVGGSIPQVAEYIALNFEEFLTLAKNSNLTADEMNFILSVISYYEFA